jgi:hypothetical protein
VHGLWRQVEHRRGGIDLESMTVPFDSEQLREAGVIADSIRSHGNLTMMDPWLHLSRS